MTMEPRGERLSVPSGREWLPPFTHAELDVALVANMAYGQTPAQNHEVRESQKDDVAVLTSALDTTRLRLAANTHTPASSLQHPRQEMLNSKISTVIPYQRLPKRASAEALAHSFRQGETLAGVVALATYVEKRKYTGKGVGVDRSVDNDDIMLNAFVRESVLSTFEFKDRRSVGAHNAPLLFGRALDMLGGIIFTDKNAESLLVALGTSLEQSLALNAQLYSVYPRKLIEMAEKVTKARDDARMMTLPREYLEGLDQSGWSAADHVAARRREYLKAQTFFLKEILYGRPFIPRPRGPMLHPRRPHD